MQARAAGKARVAVKQARPGINHSKQEPGVRKQGNLCLVTVKHSAEQTLQSQMTSCNQVLLLNQAGSTLLTGVAPVLCTRQVCYR